MGEWKTLKKEHMYIGCCGMFYCALCKYHTGTMVEAARHLNGFVETSGSIALIMKGSNVCDFDEFAKGLKWLASRDKPCKGCRFGGGWSWWSDCPARDCVLAKGIEFYHQCADFPCRRLREGPLLDYKALIIETNRKIKVIGIERHAQILKEKYKKLAAARSFKKQTHI